MRRQVKLSQDPVDARHRRADSGVDPRKSRLTGVMDFPRTLHRSPERQRRSILQPRVGVTQERLPWDLGKNMSPTPTGLHHPDEKRNPVGVGRKTQPVPRVARPSQPWAEGRNAVGVLFPPTALSGSKVMAGSMHSLARLMTRDNFRPTSSYADNPVTCAN